MTEQHPALSARGLAVGYDRHEVLAGLDLDLLAGRITALIGPNASGKSTLLKALARIQPVSSGSVLLDGADIHRLPTREVARRLGILPQAPLAPEGITVADLVRRGRHPHGRSFGWSAVDDAETIAEALELTRTAELGERPVDALSGGQRQRVWIAMVLAQRTPVVLLDEPTTFLDIAHQIEVLDLLAELRRDHGKTVVLVLHDLEQAAAYADTVVALKDGAVVASGTPTEVVTEEFVARVFGLTARVMPDPDTGSPLVLPRGRHATPASSGSSAPTEKTSTSTSTKETP